ncbi:pyridoxine/pyridoxamine 5'-phosphate oxidase-like [Arctopsyche grandis]|uniref:pyridoxine/pyridoxamine 5'-phosphate oxidase-like n=1 Tax=Arctopsyche grandis TaxID=121162 RepID=UPI00406D81CB
MSKLSSLLIGIKVQSRLQQLHSCQFLKMSVDISSLRIRYKDRSETFLEEHLVAKEPFAQFHSWFEQAKSNAKILEPNAMCLSTATKDGKPSGRFVLCKGYGKDGFKFFTNLESRKAGELKENPNAALTFYWEAMNRSIRIEGVVGTLSNEESETYFHARPVPSQIGASASHQSQPIQSRDVLCDREKILEEKYTEKGITVPKPDFWGGYILKPHTVEFWQGQRDRLHDRIRFRLPAEGEVADGVLLHQGENGWVYERLSP